MEITLIVCNVCGDKDADTTQYELKQGDRELILDLCVTHGAPFEDLLRGLPDESPDGAQKSGPRRPARRAKVTTMAEIERLKAKKKP